MPDDADDAAHDATEALRVEAAAALRGLLHAYISHACDDAELAALRDWAADMHAGDELVATCKAIYITVDPSAFAAAPDPR